ncbi:hypothetical protein [Massilia phosphatilytica]
MEQPQSFLNERADRRIPPHASNDGAPPQHPDAILRAVHRCAPP